MIAFCYHIASIRVLESQFHFKITSVEIHVVIQSRHHEFHRSDARDGGINGDHTIAIEGNVRLGDFEQIMAGLISKSECT